MGQRYNNIFFFGNNFCLPFLELEENYLKIKKEFSNLENEDFKDIKSSTDGIWKQFSFYSEGKVKKKKLLNFRKWKKIVKNVLLHLK